MGLPFKFGYAQLSSYAWYYAQSFSQRSLAGHWSAFRFCADMFGNPFPSKESVCWRRMRRVMKALKLADPSVERKCYPLTMEWLRRMMAVNGIGSPADLFCDTLPLAKLVFWARVMVAHCAMMRGCEHASGMRGGDLRLESTPAGVCEADFWDGLYTMSVGRLPEGLAPNQAGNRKLKLRPARDAILPIWNSLNSAGLWMWALTDRLSHAPVPAATTVLFPKVVCGIPQPRPLSTRSFVKHLKASATLAGLPPADVKRIEVRSLRAGGCTDAHINAMPRSSIMRQGGWRSDTVDTYNRPSIGDRWKSFARFWA